MGSDYIKERSLDEIVSDVLSVKRLFSAFDNDCITQNVPTVSIRMTKADVLARPMIEKELDQFIAKGTCPTYEESLEVILRNTFTAKVQILKEKFFLSMTTILQQRLETEFSKLGMTTAQLLELAHEKAKIPEELERAWNLYIVKESTLPYYERYVELEDIVKRYISQFL